MRLILVTPSRLEDLAGELRRSHSLMAELVAQATRRFQELDVEARGILAVEEWVRETERIGRQQEPALERLVRYLTWKAASFAEADAGAERVMPKPPPSVLGPTIGSGLSLAPKVRESRPSGWMRAAGVLKTVGGALAIAGGIAVIGMATGGVGLLFIPLGVMGVVHGVGGLGEGFLEMVTGKDEINFVEEIYAGIGGETGRQVYTAVDWGLTILDGGMAVNGFAKGVTELAAEGSAKAAAKVATQTANDGGRLLFDLANKTDTVGQIEEQFRPKP